MVAMVMPVAIGFHHAAAPSAERPAMAYGAVARYSETS